MLLIAQQWRSIIKMLSIPRQFLFIFLALLQLLAPLVHAHTSGSFGRVGLHVPGLEIVNASQLGDTASAVAYSCDAGGLVIGVNAGIRQSLIDSIADTNHYFDLPAPAQIVKPSLLGYEVNFSPHSAVVVYRLSTSLHAPRAPPAISSTWAN